MSGPVTQPHVEYELRYLRPARFEVPPQLAGLRLTSVDRRVHRDHYFDGVKDGRAVLRSAKKSLRVRFPADGEAVATYKERLKGAQPECGTVRVETEAALHGPAASPALIAVAVNRVDHPAFNAARAAAGEDVTLVELFTVTNDRRNHHFRGENGDHVILSEDHITYPDGSHEQRIEVELGRGEPALLGRIDVQLRDMSPQLTVAPRGKASEARRRTAVLLGL